jgi:hypothetical protein
MKKFTKIYYVVVAVLAVLPCLLRFIVIKTEGISPCGIEFVLTGERNILTSLGQLIHLTANAGAERIRDDQNADGLLGNFKGLLFAVFERSQLAAGNVVDNELVGDWIFYIHPHFSKAGDKGFSA